MSDPQVWLKFGQAGPGYDADCWLSGGTDGFYLIDWVQQVSVRGEDYTDEVFTVAVEGTTKDNLSANLQKLDQLRNLMEQAQEDPTPGKFLQLETKVSDETSERQARVVSVEYHFANSLNIPPASPGDYVDEYQVILTREGSWSRGRGSDALNTTIAFVGNIETGYYSSGDKHYQSYGADVGGTMPAEITRMVFSPYAFAGGPIYEVWAGFRNDRYGDRSLFEPIWDLGLNSITVGAETTAYVYDATAYNNRCAQYTPSASTSIAIRTFIKCDMVTSNYQQQRGSFLVLLRAKCTGTQTYQVRLTSGLSHFSPVTNGAVHNRVAVDKTDYFLYPVGYVDVPPGGFPEEQAVANTFIRAAALQMDAGVLTSGTGSLNLDALMLVPVSQGFVYFYADDATVMWQAGGQYSSVEIQQDHLTGRPVSVGYYDTSPRMGGASPLFTTMNWSLPNDEGSLVCFIQRYDEHDMGDQIRVDIKWNPRWHTLRGGDTGMAGT